MKIDVSDIRIAGRLEFLAKQLVEGFITGLHKSPYHGFSVEFAEHKQYNFGESTRHIDWKVFARTDRLYIKNYEEETNLRCYIVLDNSSSMHYPTDNKGKIRFASLAAAALLYLLHRQRDACGLVTFSNKVEWFSQVKSSYTHIRTLIDQLERGLEEENKQRSTNLPDIIHEVAARIHKRSLVVIFSDMISDEESREQIFSALQHLKHQKHEVILFHVHEPDTEYNFDFQNRLYEFVNIEDGNSIKLNPYEAKDYYQSQVTHFFNEIKIKCGQHKIDFIEANIQEDFQKIMLSYLAKRSKMR